MTNERPTSGIYRFKLSDIHTYAELARAEERRSDELGECLRMWETKKSRSSGCLLHDAHNGMAYIMSRKAEFYEHVVNDAEMVDHYNRKRIWHQNRAKEILAEADAIKDSVV